MSNYHTLTKAIDHVAFLSELALEGVTSRIGIANDTVSLSGPIWDAMDATQKTAELAKVATVETAHAPDTVTEVTLTAAPHLTRLSQELLAVDGVTSVSWFPPVAYPGTVVLMHNALTSVQQTALSDAALAHDASAIPKLSVGAGEEDQVIAADNVATGTVTVTDSRGALANGKTVKLRIPPGGSGNVDVDSVTLAGVGQGTFTFQVTTTFTGELVFEAYYANDEADPITFKVRRGTV